VVVADGVVVVVAVADGAAVGAGGGEASRSKAPPSAGCRALARRGCLAQARWAALVLSQWVALDLELWCSCHSRLYGVMLVVFLPSTCREEHAIDLVLSPRGAAASEIEDGSVRLPPVLVWWRCGVRLGRR
jgi:hypothetical protein